MTIIPPVHNDWIKYHSQGIPYLISNGKSFRKYTKQDRQIRTTRERFKTIIKRLIIHLIALTSSVLAAQTPPVGEEPMELTNGWQFLWGDGDGITQRLSGEDSWQTMKGLKEFSTAEGNLIWKRIRIPENAPTKENYLFIANVDQDFQVYLDGKILYKNGTLKEDGSGGGFWGFKWHMFPLPQDISGKTIYFRIYSGWQNIGLGNHVIIGSPVQIMKSMVEKDIQIVMVGFFSITTALLSLFVSTRLKGATNLIPLATFSFFIGCYLLLRSRLKFFFSEDVKLLLELELWGLYFAGISFSYLFYCVVDKFRNTRKAIISIYIIFMGVALVMSIQGTNHVNILKYFHLIIALDIVLSITSTVWAAFRGSQESRVLLGGLGMFVVAVILELLAQFHLAPAHDWYLSTGYVLFLTSIGAICVNQLLNWHNQTIALTTAAEEQKAHEIAERLKGLATLAGGMAHEINNPLFILQGNLETLASMAEQAPEEIRKRYQKSIAQMNKGIERVANITRSMDNLMDKSSEEEVMATSLEELISTSVIPCQERVAKLDIQLSIEINHGEAPIYCRPKQMGQGLYIVLSNALDAIKFQQERIIKIVADTDGDNVHIKILDSGPGIQEEDIPKIQQPFYTTKPIGQGQGLGLSVLKSILESHLGRMEFSQQQGLNCVEVIFPGVLSQSNDNEKAS